MAIKRLFPTFLWSAQTSFGSDNSFLNALAKEALLLEEEDLEGQKWCQKNYFGGYTSYGTVADLPRRSTRVEKLKSWMDREVSRFAGALEWDLRGGRLEMSACWFNVMRKGCQHSFHIHPLSVVSGTFYIKVPKGSGVFKIEDPRLGFMMGSPPRKPKVRNENQTHFLHQPKAGQLILFESWVRHEVPAFQGVGERISMSFNYDWVKG